MKWGLLPPHVSNQRGKYFSEKPLPISRQIPLATVSQISMLGGSEYSSLVECLSNLCEARVLIPSATNSSHMPWLLESKRIKHLQTG